MSQKQNKTSVLVIHGPNLNMLGKREPEVYGHTTLDEINQRLTVHGDKLGMAVETFQSNHEGDIVERIQKAMTNTAGVIINPAAFTHTSVAIRDSLLLLGVPIIEIHLSNIDKRESFRHKSFVADVAHGRIAGFGAHGYLMALGALAEILKGGRV
jgi:3-dehydroquinate dehydratase II